MCKRKQVFEKGNFAGVDAMRRSERLFNRVAPMGVADITMAVQYAHVARPPLRGIPLTSLDGLADATIERGNMAHWRAFTDGPFRNVPVAGDHYFITTHFREARPGFRACMGRQGTQRAGGVPGYQVRYAVSPASVTLALLLCSQHSRSVHAQCGHANEFMCMRCYPDLILSDYSGVPPRGARAPGRARPRRWRRAAGHGALVGRPAHKRRRGAPRIGARAHVPRLHYIIIGCPLDEWMGAPWMLCQEGEVRATRPCSWLASLLMLFELPFKIKQSQRHAG